MIVVIPAYEPDEKMLKLIRELREKTDYDIVVVDDGSSAKCMPVFSDAERLATVLHHDINRGKGRAMKTAFEYIKTHFPLQEGVVTVDADGQHLLADIVRVCEVYRENEDALVLGGRAFTGKVPLRSRLGNGITRFVFALSTGVRVHDTQTGLRAFSVKKIDEMLAVGGERYEYEINQLLTCTKERTRIIEVEIETVYINENETSHFHALKDSWRIYKTIFAFVASSIISWVVDYVLLLGLTLLIAHFTNGAGFTLFGTAIEPKIPALIIARLVSSIVNYVLNQRMVFKSRAKGSIVRYYITVALILVLNYGLLYVMTGSGIHLAIAQILAQLIIYPLNFLLQRAFVFNERKKTE